MATGIATSRAMGPEANKRRLSYDDDNERLSQIKLTGSSSEQTPVGSMFYGRSVFITGASGFIGRVLLEKLLRSYQGIERIYILIRAKRNVSPVERLNKQLLNVPAFDTIRAMKNGPELLNKIVVIAGDIGEENWAIEAAELNMMLADPTLAIVFHSAATVRFEEPLDSAIRYNLNAVETLIKLCKRMPNLIALCHVSTAYVNSNIKDNSHIVEQLYPIDYGPNQVLKIQRALDDKLLREIKPRLVGDLPNTYTYTKALAEHLLATEASALPVVIVRPSIVVASWKEPIPGWIDNRNGITGVIMAIGNGLVRSMCAKGSNKADIIPVDMVVNCLIASAYHVASSNVERPPATTLVAPALGETNMGVKEEEEEEEEEDHGKEEELATTKSKVLAPPIFHCTSGELNPFTWSNMEEAVISMSAKFPSKEVLRYPGGSLKGSQYLDTVSRYVDHYLPALMIDLMCMVMGRKQQMLPIYSKIHAALAVLAHFITTNYNFKSANIKLLQATLAHPTDRETLYMDITKVDWNSFWENYVLGVRRFMMKEDDESLGEARRALRRVYYRELAIRLSVSALALYCCTPLLARLLKSVIGAPGSLARRTSTKGVL